MCRRSEYEAFCAAETEHYDQPKQGKNDYVFRRKGMKLPMTSSTFTWRLKKTLKANGLPTDSNVHSPRRTAASLFIAGGTDVGTVAGLLGYSRPSTTLDIYFNLELHWLRLTVLHLLCSLATGLGRGGR